MHESPRSSAVIWVIAAALAVVAGIRLLGGGDPDMPPVRVDSSPARGVAERPSAPASELYVHVAGAVRRPGLIRLGAGSRVATALEPPMDEDDP